MAMCRPNKTPRRLLAESRGTAKPVARFDMVTVSPPAVPFHVPAAIVQPAEPRLSDLLPTYADAVTPPAWWCNPSADYRLSEKDAAELAEYEAWLDDQARSADYDERAARAADELDMMPAGADCHGFALGSWDAPRELTYVPDEAGVMFCDDIEPPLEPAYL